MHKIYTRDGSAIEVAEDSHVMDHGVFQLLSEAAVLHLDAEDRPFILQQIDMGREIGLNHCVPTESRSGVYYAKRGTRPRHTRMVEGIKPTPCSTLVVVLAQQESGAYKAITAYVGTVSPREPWDPSIQKDASLLLESARFWSRHALVDDKSTFVQHYQEGGVPPEWEWLDMWETPCAECGSRYIDSGSVCYCGCL